MSAPKAHRKLNHRQMNTIESYQGCGKLLESSATGIKLCLRYAEDMMMSYVKLGTELCSKSAEIRDCKCEYLHTE